MLGSLLVQHSHPYCWGHLILLIDSTHIQDLVLPILEGDIRNPGLVLSGYYVRLVHGSMTWYPGPRYYYLVVLPSLPGALVPHHKGALLFLQVLLSKPRSHDFLMLNSFLAQLNDVWVSPSSLLVMTDLCKIWQEHIE